MNLKEAAREIGVHYQTAYKWVRSGELAAVRIGSRYEVSTAAIDQFLANRRCTVDQAVLGRDGSEPDEPRRVSDIPPEDFLEELEAMLTDPIITIPALEGFVARRSAHLLGDAVLVAIDDADGTVRHALVDHPRTDRAAFYNAMIGLSGAGRAGQQGALGRGFADGRSVRTAVIDQARLRRQLSAELRQYLDDYPIYSLVGAEIEVGGVPRGMIVLTRDNPHHPYSSADEEVVRRIAARVGPLVGAADDIDAAWSLRRNLHDLTADALTRRRPGRPFSSDELGALLFGPGSAAGASPLGCVVWSPDDRILAVNDAIVREFGWERDELIGRSRAETVPEEELTADGAAWAKLRSGEIDFDDACGFRRRADGSAHRLAVHRAAVREPDATLACIIAVGRPIREGPFDSEPPAITG